MPSRAAAGLILALLGALMGAAALGPGRLHAQDAGSVEVHARLSLSAPAKRSAEAPSRSPASNAGPQTIPALIWLLPAGRPNLPFLPGGPYTLVQKHRMFSPHLLVVPVGSLVRFPNADPFFHDVFSLFDGKRFDLGLYEAGTTKEVRFSREGFSYIFCNIHPEMSAVVVALSTPLYAVANERGEFVVHDVPPGEYELHVWLEGADASSLDKLTRRVHLDVGRADLGTIPILSTPRASRPHANKFGEPYTPTPKDAYGPAGP